MIFPKVDPAEWAKQWKLEMAPIECPQCKQSFTPCIPAALSGYRGLVCEPHACGLNYQASVFRPIGKAYKELMRILSS